MIKKLLKLLNSDKVQYTLVGKKELATRLTTMRLVLELKDDKAVIEQALSFLDLITNECAVSGKTLIIYKKDKKIVFKEYFDA